jgi:hypothetical protein
MMRLLHREIVKSLIVLRLIAGVGQHEALVAPALPLGNDIAAFRDAVLIGGADTSVRPVLPQPCTCAPTARQHGCHEGQEKDAR